VTARGEGAPAAPVQPPRLPILYEDRWLVAIDKPSGLASVPSEGFTGRTCIAELRRSHPTARAVHRLDRDVTGVMLVALDEGTRAALERQFRERTLEKIYLAVARGVPRPPAGTIRKPIADLGKHARVARRGRAGAFPAAPAVTHYKVRRTFEIAGAAPAAASLVEVRLETGRYNQIRVHFAAIGHPLVGERKYARGRESPVRFRRVALHAWKLAFSHPRTGAPIRLEAPLPADLAGLLESLDRPSA
jgi:23S rRNA pseudouridine1911/1915/1917 synthase